MTSPHDDGPLSRNIWLRDTYFGFITKVVKQQRFKNITQRLALLQAAAAGAQI